MSRVAGKRGRVIGETGHVPFVTNYTDLARIVNYPVDESQGITNWGMYGNDKYGDCTFCGWIHTRMAKAAAGKLKEVWESAATLVAAYFKYTGGQDVGANIPDLLLYWYKSGAILGFGALDHKNHNEVDWGTVTFHGAYCGVILTDDADHEFESHTPWKVGPGEQPNPQDGHCIVKIGATGTGPNDLDSWITWGAIQKSTTGWTKASLQEAYVIITEEDAKAANLDIAALRVDLDALVDRHGEYVAPAKKSLLQCIFGVFKRNE